MGMEWCASRIGADYDDNRQNFKPAGQTRKESCGNEVPTKILEANDTIDSISYA